LEEAMPGKSSLLRELFKRPTSLTSHDRCIDQSLMREASAISSYLCASKHEVLQKLRSWNHGVPPHNNSQIDSNATSLILLQRYLLPTSLNTRSRSKQVLGSCRFDLSQAVSYIISTKAMANKHSSRKKNRPGIKKHHTKPDAEELVNTSVSAQPESHSLLLKLPPELRNRIYEYALRFDNGICEVNETVGIPESALLLTCKEIRQEAIGIFYSANKVHVELESFSPAMPILIEKKMCALHKQYGYKIEINSLSTRGPRNWRNLMSWLKTVHGPQRSPFGILGVSSMLENQPYSQQADLTAKEMAMLAGLFQVASMTTDLPWDEVEKALNILRYGVVQYSSEWEVD
jgi:hypothetical protein